MAGEIRQDQDQERFEDYLELEHYIEQLQAGHVAHPPSELTPAKARIYSIAALFRSASAEEGIPRPAFAATLHARLEQELQQPTKPQQYPLHAREPSSPPRKKRPNVSRRALITGGAAAAAALVVGAGLGASVESLTQPRASGPQAPIKPWPTPLVPDGEGSWVAVVKVADLGDQAFRFATDSIVGYLIRSDGDNGEKPGVIAVSAACTHMGCIVQWQNADRKYHCPCHGGLFSEYGKPDKASPIRYPALPRLETRITKHSTGEFIEVRMPRVQGQHDHSTGSGNQLNG